MRRGGITASVKKQACWHEARRWHAHLLVGEAVKGPGQRAHAAGKREVRVGQRGPDEVGRVGAGIASLVVYFVHAGCFGVVVVVVFWGGGIRDTSYVLAFCVSVYA